MFSVHCPDIFPGIVSRNTVPGAVFVNRLPMEQERIGKHVFDMIHIPVATEYIPAACGMNIESTLLTVLNQYFLDNYERMDDGLTSLTSLTIFI